MENEGTTQIHVCNEYCLRNEEHEDEDDYPSTEDDQGDEEKQNETVVQFDNTKNGLEISLISPGTSITSVSLADKKNDNARRSDIKKIRTYSVDNESSAKRIKKN